MDYIRNWRRYHAEVDKLVQSSDEQDLQQLSPCFSVSEKENESFKGKDGRPESSGCNDSSISDNNTATSDFGNFSESETCSSIDDNSEYDSDRVEEQVPDVVADLAGWATQSKCTRSSLNELLEILRKQGLRLPKDSRTLLQTPRSINTIRKCDEDYLYLGLETGLLKIQKTIVKNLTSLPQQKFPMRRRIPSKEKGKEFPRKKTYPEFDTGDIAPTSEKQFGEVATPRSNPLPPLPPPPALKSSLGDSRTAFEETRNTSSSERSMSPPQTPRVSSGDKTSASLLFLLGKSKNRVSRSSPEPTPSTSNMYRGRRSSPEPTPSTSNMSKGRRSSPEPTPSRSNMSKGRRSSPEPTPSRSNMSEGRRSSPEPTPSSSNRINIVQPPRERDGDFLPRQSLIIKVGEVHGHRKVDQDQDLVAIGQDQDTLCQDQDAIDQDRNQEDRTLGHQTTDPDHQVQPPEGKPKVGMLTMRYRKSKRYIMQIGGKNWTDHLKKAMLSILQKISEVRSLSNPSYIKRSDCQDLGACDALLFLKVTRDK
ncbi:unnamed protein product [Mytilus coruscus]|uniref:Uncharacterized protein n=1 Tax=Mytilus coruscus TaxID=42192 RepID=A0A6J8D0M6_MYTCO|nr:unnamed protein product [Mytilus coruscus]